MPLISEDVLLRIRGQWAGNEVQRGLRQLETEVQRVGRSARNALSLLLPGAGLGIAGGIALAVRESIKLASEFEKMKLGLASILGSYGDVVDAQGRVLKGAERFNSLLRMSASLMTEIRKEADRTILETRELMEYVQTGLGFGLAKGLSQQQIVRLISTIAVAGRTLGLPQGYPIISEIRAILTGQNLRQSQIAQAVGLTAQQLERLRGDELFQYIANRLKGFVDASDRFAQSFEASWSTFISKVQEVLATVGEAIVPVLAEFARDAARAFDEWKRTGGPQRLQQFVREVLQSIVGIAQWLGNVAKWFKENPTALRLARDIGAAAVGARVGGIFGPWGALVGGLAGAAGIEIATTPDRAPPPTPVERQFLEQLFSRYEAGANIDRQYILRSLLTYYERGAISHTEFLHYYRRYATLGAKPRAAAGGGGFRARPMPPSEGSIREAEKRRREQQAIAQRASEMSTRLAVRQADGRLQQALQDASAMGWTPQAVARVRSAYEAWKQASLRSASAQAAGEPTPIARQIIAEAQYEVTDRKREIEDAIQRGMKEAQAESARQAQEMIEYRRQRVAGLLGTPLPERLYEAFTGTMPLTARIAAAPFAPIGVEMVRTVLQAAQEREQLLSEQTRRFARMMTESAALEEQRRVLSYRAYQGFAALGAPWAQAFGVAAPLAGAARFMAGVLSPVGQALVDAVAEAQMRIREEWQQFWQDMATFTSNSMRDAFVRLTMDLMSNINRWGDALKDFVRSVKQMIQRAIAEYIYENLIKRGVESLLGGILGKAQRGGQKPNIGQIIGGVALSAVIGWGLGQIFPGLGIFQHGGTAIGGRLALVGERGPELVVPGVTSAVVTADAVARALANLSASAGPAQMNIYINHDGDLGLAARVGREVERGLRRWRY